MTAIVASTLAASIAGCGGARAAERAQAEVQSDTQAAAVASVDEQEAPDFLLPVAAQVRGWYDQRRKGAGCGKAGEGLHGFTKAHLIGKQRALVTHEEGQAFLLEGHECPGKGAFRRRHALGQGGGQGFAQGILARAGDGFLPPGEIFQLHLQREAEHQPEQVGDRSAVIDKPRLTASSTLGTGEKPLAHLCDGRVRAHHPAAALLIVGERAQRRTGRPGLRAQIHGKKRLVGFLRWRFFFP